MGAFQIANDAMYRDRNFGFDAIYSGAPDTPVRLMWSAPDESVSLSHMRTRLPQTRAMVRVSEVPNPQKGETMTIDGVVFEIGNRLRDEERLNWHLDLKTV